MTPREAYKFGFLCRCVEEGLDPAQTQQRIDQALEKRATGPKDLLEWGKLPFTLGGATIDLAAKGFPLALGLGAASGAGIGTVLAHLNRKELDEDEIRRRELIDTYNLFADRALEKSKAHHEAFHLGKAS